jgi:hypothetical protein
LAIRRPPCGKFEIGPRNVWVGNSFGGGFTFYHHSAPIRCLAGTVSSPE